MDNNKKNEELQSRREFFKNAAKAALPVLGAVVLANLPIVAEAASGCKAGCAGTCYYSCRTTCDKTCKDTCKGTCINTCKGGCKTGHLTH